jgi:hypothetical protein
MRPDPSAQASYSRHFPTHHSRRLLTSLCERTFTVIREKFDDILTVTEEQITEAMT